MKHRFMEEKIKYSEVVTVLAQLIYPNVKLPPAKIKIRRQLRTARDNKSFTTFEINDVLYVHTHEFFNWAHLKWDTLVNHIEVRPGAQIASEPMELPSLSVQSFMSETPSDRTEADKQHAQLQYELYMEKAEHHKDKQALKKHEQAREKRIRDGHLNGPGAWDKVKAKRNKELTPEK